MKKIGRFKNLFTKAAVQQATGGYLETLTMYQPVFTDFNGGVYEALTCRAAIHSFANHCSKLKIEMDTNRANLQKMISLRPNPWQTTSQFLYQVATILEIHTAVILAPVMDLKREKVEGIIGLTPADVNVVTKGGREFIAYVYPNGDKEIVPSDKIQLLTKFQYNNIGGEGNKPIMPTVKLIDTMQQAMDQGVKNSSAIRFIATLAGVFKKKDIEKTQQTFAETNLQRNDTGVMIFDEKFKDVKQVESNPIYVDDKQMELINRNVDKFFGTNEKIMTNNYTEEEWAAFYEGKIEPFAIQLQEALTCLFRALGMVSMSAEIRVSSNRLECSSLTTKISVVTQMFDRGMMTVNNGLKMFGLEGIGKEGDKLYIRKEYAQLDKLNQSQGVE